MPENEYNKLSNCEKFIYRALYENNSIDNRTKIILSMFDNLDYTGQYLFASPEKIADETGIDMNEVEAVYSELEMGVNPVLIKKHEGFYCVNGKQGG